MNLLPNSCQQTGKKSEKGKKRAHTPTPLPRLHKNFCYYCDTTFSSVSTKRVKNITVTVSVRVSVTVRVSSVQFYLLALTLLVRQVSPSADVVYIRY